VEPLRGLSWHVAGNVLGSERARGGRGVGGLKGGVPGGRRWIGGGLARREGVGGWIEVGVLWVMRGGSHVEGGVLVRLGGCWDGAEGVVPGR